MKLAGRAQSARRPAACPLTASSAAKRHEAVDMTAESIPRSHCSPGERFGLSPGEVHFLWWLIKGSITNPETREHLHRAWGMCARHAVALLAVEAAYRHGWMYACATLYLDLVERGLAALTTRGLLSEERSIRQLHAIGPCLMCDLDRERAGGGAAPADLLERGRDPHPLGAFAEETKSHWAGLVCRLCSTVASGPLCRVHLISDHGLDLADEVRSQRAALGYIARQLIRYARSFRW
jgi:hypothetical protein